MFSEICSSIITWKKQQSNLTTIKHGVINILNKWLNIDAITAQNVIEELGVNYASALYVASEVEKLSLVNENKNDIL